MTSSVFESADVQSVQQACEFLNNIIQGTDCSAMSEDELAQHRKCLAKTQSTVQEGLSKTTQKKLNFDENEISDYIDWVLRRGFELIKTNPGDARKLDDAQNLRRYKSLIRERVKASLFGEKQFKIKALSVQRAAIESSKTLHELRQNIKAMIPVLRLYRDYQALEISYKKLMDSCKSIVPLEDYNALMHEFETLQSLCDERQSTLDYIVDGLYKPAGEISGEELLKAVDDFKVTHDCSDAEAVKAFGTSRSTITRLRRKYKDAVEQ